MNRRQHLKNLALGFGTMAIGSGLQVSEICPTNNGQGESLIKHSVSRWCFANITLEALTEFCSVHGIQSIELLEPDEYRKVFRKGLTCAVANGPASHIQRGFNDPAIHDYLLKEYQRLIPLAAEAGIPNIICFSGNRAGLGDKEGIENCARGLDPVVKLAEKHGIHLIMELLNSKVDHPDYQCDHSAWGIELVQKIGSDRFKLLYDIYHMQIMEGNIIDTIRKNISFLAHFHTAGVPGRNDLDHLQELNYTAIFKAIKETGYSGYIGQEFLPKKDKPLESLLDAVQLVNQA